MPQTKKKLIPLRGYFACYCFKTLAILCSDTGNVRYYIPGDERNLVLLYKLLSQIFALCRKAQRHFYFNLPVIGIWAVSSSIYRSADRRIEKAFLCSRAASSVALADEFWRSLQNKMAATEIIRSCVKTVKRGWGGSCESLQKVKCP